MRNTKFINQSSSKIFLTLGFSCLLVSCGSGGDSGGGTPAPSGTVVSGSVQAPNSQIAFNNSPGLLEKFVNFFFQPTYASISGLSAVPDGTTVQLARLDASGTGSTVLSSTTTAGGRYSFNLTNLGTQFSNDLIVQVLGPAKVMRAFVTTTTVDVDPGSELAVRLVLEQIAATQGATLQQFTLKEVNDVACSLKLLTTVTNLTGGADLETTITTIRNAVNVHPDLVAFVAAAAAAGQTAQSPGDVANYFPYSQGNSWAFQGTFALTGAPTIKFKNTRSINGTNVVGGLTTIVRSESNPSNSGTPIDEYVMKDTTSITIRGNNYPADPITPQIIPYQEVQFPLQTGASFQSVNKSGLDFGQDLDGDGKNETVAVTSQVTVIDFETLVVSAGTFANTVQIRSHTTARVTLSKQGSRDTITSTTTLWFAPGVGPIKRQDVIRRNGVTATIVEQLVGFMVNGQGTGMVPLTIANGVAKGNSNTQNPGPSGIGSDGTNYLVVFYQDLVSPAGLYGKLTGGGTGLPFLIAPLGFPPGVSSGVAFDGSNYLVTYSLNGNIMGVRISPSGNILDSLGGFAIATGSQSGGNAFSSAAYDGTNYLVAYAKFTGTGYNIYGTRVSPAGQTLGEFPIYTATGSHVFPKLAFDGTNYLVVWTAQVPVSTPSGFITRQHILGARVSPGGAVLDPNGIAIATAPESQDNPSLAFDGTNYLVVWLNGTQDPIPLYGKRIKTDGTLLDGSASSLGIPIETTVTGKREPTVTFNGTNYLVVWAVAVFPSTVAPNGVYGAEISTGGQVLLSQSNPLGTLLTGPPQNSDAILANPVASSNRSTTLVTWIYNRELQGSTKSIQGLLISP